MKTLSVTDQELAYLSIALTSCEDKIKEINNETNELGGTQVLYDFKSLHNKVRALQDSYVEEKELMAV
jgi:hypothetical protein